MLSAFSFDGGLADHLSRIGAMTASGLRLFWLGQAGFLIESLSARILIDPYLSNSLAAKYAGTRFPHERMMPAPIAPEALGRIDLVICTHRHTDHMDGETLQPLCARLPDVRVIVPAAERDEAMRRTGVSAGRLLCLDAGDWCEPLPGVVVRAVAAAHETLDTDTLGRHRFLGYGVSAGDVTVFHSGDTIPFPGQVEAAEALNADLALLPVNGRSKALLHSGFAGNLTLDEALGLSCAAGIPAMIAHHHGMFAFNTLGKSVV